LVQKIGFADAQTVALGGFDYRILRASPGRLNLPLSRRLKSDTA
jgi:hypothetical protein